jgi:hypothetical protein
MNKTYYYKGQKIHERNELSVKSVQVEKIKTIATREYFAD